MSFWESCRELIAKDSSPSQTCLEAVNYLASLANEMGFKTEVHTETSKGLTDANLIVRPGPKSQNEFLLQTHLDSVEPGPFALWTKTQSNPFNASIYGDVIYGLGSADSKLDFLCKLEAAKQFLGQPMRCPFVLVATFGAQSAMTGAQKLLRKNLIHAKKALIGEPTELRLVLEGQGTAVVEVTLPFSDEEKEYRKNHDVMESVTTQSKMFHGRSALSGAPGMGDNAIIKMLEYLSQLPESVGIMDLNGGVSFNTVPSTAFLEIDIAGGFRDSIVPKIKALLDAIRVCEADFKNYPAQQFEQPLATMNIGMIRTFEDHISILGSCRFPPSVPQEVYENWMKQLEAACSEQGANFALKDLKRPFALNQDSEFAQALKTISKKMGLPTEVCALNTTTESSVFSRAGIECVAFGPGTSFGNSHEPNERVLLSELQQATDFYRHAIERFCI